MPKVNSSVIDCSNSTYKTNKGKKKLAQNTTLKLRETALNLNHPFMYILFLAPLNITN